MIGNRKECIDYLLEQEDKTFEVKEHKAKRSNNANSYYWTLLGKIADALRTSKDELHEKYLEEYGQSFLVPVEVGTVPKGYFRHYRYVTTNQINGKDADWYKVMKGSSDFDSREMSILIDGVVQDAKALDIEVLPEEEIERLKEMWS